MGPCYGLAFFGINELVVTVSLRVAVTTSQAAKDELLTWKLKNTVRSYVTMKLFWLVGSGVSTVLFLEGTRQIGAHYTADDWMKPK